MRHGRETSLVRMVVSAAPCPMRLVLPDRLAVEPELLSDGDGKVDVFGRLLGAPCCDRGGDTMSLYRKKPVVIEAIQWTGENGDEIADFLGRENQGVGGWMFTNQTQWTPLAFVIHTLEGDHRADVGDWIIKGVKGEFYPCKPAIFDLTYEAVGEGSC